MRSNCCDSSADLDVLYVPIGQGSGICGCILARDLLGLKTEIVGVQSTEAPSYALSFAAGTVVRTNSSNTLRRRHGDAGSRSRRACRSFARAPRASSRSPTTRSPRRSAPTGPTPTISPKAPAPPRSRPRCRRRAKLRGKRVGLILSGGNIDFDLFQTMDRSGKRSCHRRRQGAGVSAELGTTTDEPARP